MSYFLSYNGEIFSGDTPIVIADNRGLRYGDGLFETMKLIKQRISLSDLHFQRLFDGLRILKIEIPAYLTIEFLYEQIQNVCQKNSISEAARVRVNVFRGKGELKEKVVQSDTIIQAWPLPESHSTFNNEGLMIEVYPHARKSCDLFSNLKSNNYLPYVMAANFARENNLDDCLLLNSRERICDATIANIFWVKDNNIYTPPLSEGCVGGVMRKYLLANISGGLQITEKPLEIEDLNTADECFLTNAVYGIQWVKQFRRTLYQNQISSGLYRQIQEKLNW